MKSSQIMEQSMAGRASIAVLESRLSVILLWDLHEGNQQTEQGNEREGLFSNRAVWLGKVFYLTDVVNSQLFDHFTVQDRPHTPGHTHHLLHCMDVFEWIGAVAVSLNGDRYVIGAVLFCHSQIKWVPSNPGRHCFHASIYVNILTLPSNTTLSSTLLCSWFQRI